MSNVCASSCFSTNIIYLNNTEKRVKAVNELANDELKQHFFVGKALSVKKVICGLTNNAIKKGDCEVASV